jgi:hypothetical protein
VILIFAFFLFLHFFSRVARKEGKKSAKKREKEKIEYFFLKLKYE